MFLVFDSPTAFDIVLYSNLYVCSWSCCIHTVCSVRVPGVSRIVDGEGLKRCRKM